MFLVDAKIVCLFYRLVIAFFWAGLLVTEGTVSKERYFPKYNFYHNLSKLNECIHDYAVGYPDIIDVEMYYRSRLGLSQYLIHITNNANTGKRIKSDTRARVLLSFGEHSSEFFPVESMLNLLKNITTGYDRPTDTLAGNFTAFILKNIDLYVVALVNPDGRAIIERTGDYCWKQTSNEVDLNVDPTIINTKGKTNENNRIVTEPECKFLSGLLSKRFDAFVSFHSGGRGVFVPQRGGIARTAVSLVSELDNLASQLSATVSPGVSPVFVKVTDFEDYSIFSHVYLIKKVPFTYTVSMWGNGNQKESVKDCFGLYNPENEKLEEALNTVHPVYATLFQFVHKWRETELTRELLHMKEVKKTEKGMPYKTIIFLLSLCIVVYLIGKYKFPLSWKVFYRRQRRIVSIRSLASAFI